MEFALIGSALVGLGLALAAFAGWEHYRRAFAYVEADFRDKLRRLRRPTKNLRKWLIAWLGGVAGVTLLVWIGLGMPVLGVLLGVLMVCLPWYVLRNIAAQRREQIEDQLADAMVSLSSAVRAGLSLAQSIEILSRQCPAPISQEFQQFHGEYQMGKTLEVCLKETKARLQSENFALFAAAVEASRQSGGRLNETIERIAYSVRELQRLERKIQSETAHARKSAVYMALAPVFILLLYYFAVDAENTARLFTQVPGQIILAIAVVLNLLAYLWARSILSTEI
jgi:tight adherence protein B